MRFQFIHEFATSSNVFWEVFFSPAYNEDLYRRLPIQSRRVLEQTTSLDGNVIHRIQELSPKLSLPSWAQSIVKDLSYREYNEYIKSQSVMEVRIESQTLQERFECMGTYVVKPLAENRCRREYTGELNIRIPLLGKKLESHLMKQLNESENIVVQVTEAWIAKQNSASSPRKYTAQVA